MRMRAKKHKMIFLCQNYAAATPTLTYAGDWLLRNNEKKKVERGVGLACLTLCGTTLAAPRGGHGGPAL